MSLNTLRDRVRRTRKALDAGKCGVALRELRETSHAFGRYEARGGEASYEARQVGAADTTNRERFEQLCLRK